ncbi:hypothetical protein SK128_014661, partial [Halocaridina rubra]
AVDEEKVELLHTSVEVRRRDAKVLQDKNNSMIPVIIEEYRLDELLQKTVDTLPSYYTVSEVLVTVKERTKPEKNMLQLCVINGEYPSAQDTVGFLYGKYHHYDLHLYIRINHVKITLHSSPKNIIKRQVRSCHKNNHPNKYKKLVNSPLQPRILEYSPNKSRKLVHCPVQPIKAVKSLIKTNKPVNSPVKPKKSSDVPDIPHKLVQSPTQPKKGDNSFNKPKKPSNSAQKSEKMNFSTNTTPVALRKLKLS